MNKFIVYNRGQTKIGINVSHITNLNNEEDSNILYIETAGGVFRLRLPSKEFAFKAMQKFVEFLKNDDPVLEIGTSEL